MSTLDFEAALKRREELSEIAKQAVSAADKLIMAGCRDEYEISCLTAEVTTLMAAKVAMGAQLQLIKSKIVPDRKS